MDLEEVGELGVVALHVLRVGQQRGIVGHDRGERGAEAEQVDELVLDVGYLLVC